MQWVMRICIHSPHFPESFGTLWGILHKLLFWQRDCNVIRFRPFCRCGFRPGIPWTLNDSFYSWKKGASAHLLNLKKGGGEESPSYFHAVNIFSPTQNFWGCQFSHEKIRSYPIISKELQWLRLTWGPGFPCWPGGPGSPWGPCHRKI